MSVDKYRELILDAWNWGENDAKLAFSTLYIWWDGLYAYIESEGEVDSIAAICGSPGEFFTGANLISNWLMARRIDPYPFWDVALAVEDRLDGGSTSVDDIRRMSDRAILIYQHLYFLAEEPDGTSPPRRRAGRKVDEKTLDIIEAINSGEDLGDIANRFKVTPDNIYTIKSRHVTKKAKS